MKAVNTLKTLLGGLKNLKDLMMIAGSALISELSTILGTLQKWVRIYGLRLLSPSSRMLSRLYARKCTRRSIGPKESKIRQLKRIEKRLARKNAETYYQCSINGELPTIKQRLTDTGWMKQ